MNTNLIKPKEDLTEANKGNKELFFVSFVAFYKVPLLLAILGLPSLGANAGVSLTTLHNFNVFINGKDPSSLMQGSDGNFYGTTAFGGTNGGWGTVFKISGSGVLTSLHSFDGADGANPLAALVQGSDGYFYGTTVSGGTTYAVSGTFNGYGTVFRISASGEFINLHSFAEWDGANPVTALVQGSDGFFYGTTFGSYYQYSQGSSWTPSSSDGTVFKIDASGDFTNLYSFTGEADGAFPSGLAQGSGGNFYGATDTIYWSPDGPSGPETVFKISPSGGLTSLSSNFFGGAESPYAALVPASDGNFYGAAGYVFKISTNGDLTTFNTNVDSYAALVQGSDGYFYGTTSGGYANANFTPGTVFKISPSGESTTLYSFTGGPDGAGSDVALVQGSDGNFYGTTDGDGTNVYGTVFKISPSGVFTNLYSFTGVADAGSPETALVRGSDGNFYGTTYWGGTNDDGTVFKIRSSGVLTNLYYFAGADGFWPRAALVQGSDGNFYGTTFYGGGTNGNGTVFEISATGEFTNLHSFTGGLDGANPQAALVQGSDGYFYGTTSFGGTHGDGTLFKISANGTLTPLHSFTGADGEDAQAALLQGSDGSFYGTTYYGGANGASGTVFKISPSGALTTLHSFTGELDGICPQAALVQGSDGNLYGTTTGYPYGFGTVFQISPGGVFITVYNFTGGADGSDPQAGLVQGSDGSFYGTTSGGGQGGAGTVFRLTIVPEFQAVTLTNNMLSLNWSTEAGGMYQLQYTSDLSSINWINLRSPVTATGATLSTTEIITNGPQRFYRLVLLRYGF